jgi:hypothetical protein
MGLALGLGIAVALVVRTFLPHKVSRLWEPVAVVAMLIAVWAMNFLVLLPAINPGFVELVPYGASLTSKVLFGVASAFILWCAGPQRSAAR